MLRRTPLPRKRQKPRRKGKPAPRLKPGRVEDPKRLARVRALGCIVCHRLGLGFVHAEAHHPRTGVGMGQKAGDDRAIPLCADHHRTGGPGVAFHAGPRLWESIHGTQAELLEETNRMLAGNDVPVAPEDDPQYA